MTEATSPATSAHEAVQILIVDDHRDNLLALDALLSPLGHRILQAESGCAALKILLEQQQEELQQTNEELEEKSRLLARQNQERHNLVADGPFNEFNLILCRNVSLANFGVLGLGARETLSLTPLENRYEELDATHRLYRRVA